MTQHPPEPGVQQRALGPRDPLWVAIGLVLATCLGIIGGLLTVSTGASLAESFLAGAACFAGALTLYLLVLVTLRNSG